MRINFIFTSVLLFILANLNYAQSPLSPCGE